MKTHYTYLFETAPPWIYLGSGEPERMKWIPQVFYSHLGVNTYVRELLGKKMRTVSGLMNEFRAALQFFEEFGENWYALSDCLRDSELGKSILSNGECLKADAFILVVEGAEEVLTDESLEQLEALLLTLNEVAKSWATPIVDNGQFNHKPIPFHTLLHTSNTDMTGINRIKDVAKKAGISIRR
jgi:hypothetical protein